MDFIFSGVTSSSAIKEVLYMQHSIVLVPAALAYLSSQLCSWCLKAQCRQHVLIQLFWFFLTVSCIWLMWLVHCLSLPWFAAPCCLLASTLLRYFFRWERDRVLMTTHKTESVNTCIPVGRMCVAFCILYCVFTDYMVTWVCVHSGECSSLCSVL